MANIEKKTAENVVDTRPKAFARHIRMSPDKVRIVLDLIRGKDYFEARAILLNTPNFACVPVRKVVDSAAANAEYKNYSKADLYIAEIFADAGPIQKRIAARARGSASRILKRSCHISVILDSKVK